MEEVKDTNPGTVAKPTNMSCLLGKVMPELGCVADALLMMGWLKLCSLPLQASMKNNFGLPTKVEISETSVMRDSMFQVLLASLSCRKLSDVPWLITRTRKQLLSE